MTLVYFLVSKTSFGDNNNVILKNYPPHNSFDKIQRSPLPNFFPWNVRK